MFAWLLTLELEVREQRNVVHPGLALGQLGEEQEPAPTLPRPRTDTLQLERQRIEIRIGDPPSPNDTERAEPFERDQHEGEQDADGEDPFRDGERDGGFDLAGPSVEGEQVDGGEHVGGEDGESDDDEEPQPDVGEEGET